MHQVNYDYLRPKKATHLKRMYASPFELRQDLTLWHGENATILPLKKFNDDQLMFGRGGVVDKSGQYVPLSGIESRVQYSYPFDHSVHKNEKVVYCGYLINHWGHFLVEAVTRLWYVLENDNTIDKYVFFLDANEERTIEGNYKEFFLLLKIWDKIEIINTPTTYREIIVPEMSLQCMKYYSPKFIDIFDTIANNVNIDSSWNRQDKIYFTRSQFAQGNNYEFGLEALDNFFSKNGFTILAPEKVPLSQMIFYIRNATEIASISGSTPHNMLFAANGQKIVIMERLVMNDDHQVCINQMRNLDSTHIDASFHIYSVDFCGPYILGYNHILEQYIKDNNMILPDAYYYSEEYREKCFKQYMRSYRENYKFRWFMADWYPGISDSIWEAYQDSYTYFHTYLDGNKPFLQEHYFQWHYWKQFIKRILRK